ncbi:MAG TPA: hypothetical protein PLV92_03155, partial [Pirellulaceae bacterium]|nr:hypothetical protein [Pirellulaceae bacterium]
MHRALIQRLETLQRAGVTHIPRVALSATPAVSATSAMSSAAAQDRAGMERAGLDRAVQDRAAQDRAAQDRANQPSPSGGMASDARPASPSHRAPTIGAATPGLGTSTPTPASASAYGHDTADPNAAASLSGMAAEVQRNLGNDAMAKRTTGGKATGARTPPSAAGPQPPAAGNKLLALGDSRPAPLPLAQRQAALQVLNAE